MDSLLAFEDLCRILDKQYGDPANNSVTFCKNCSKENRSFNTKCENCNRPLEIDMKFNSKFRHFRTVMRVLAEHGVVTIDEISRLDVYEERVKLRHGRAVDYSTKKARKNRASEYYRIIEGSWHNNVRGLIEKGLIIRAGAKASGNKDRKYRLTVQGVLYALYLFNQRKIGAKIQLPDIYKKEDNFINAIAENYKDYFPLIFGKWNFLKQCEIPVYAIQLFAYFGKIHVPLMVLMKMVREVTGENRSQNAISDDFSLWFYATVIKVCRASFSFKTLNDDKELVNWLKKNFEEYLDSLVDEIERTQKIIRRLPLLTEWSRLRRNSKIINS